MDTRPDPSSPSLASPWRRGVCYLIDSMIAFGLVFAVQGALLVPVREELGLDEQWFHSGWKTEVYTLLTISLPVWTLFALGDSAWRGLGRRLMGISVRRIGSGAVLRFPRALARTAVKLLPWEVAHLANNLPTPMWYADDPELRVLFPVSGVLFAGWMLLVVLRADRRGPHDLLCGTLVISRRGR